MKSLRVSRYIIHIIHTCDSAPMLDVPIVCTERDDAANIILHIKTILLEQDHTALRGEMCQALVCNALD
jgi:hypothetical protein